MERYLEGLNAKELLSCNGEVGAEAVKLLSSLKDMGLAWCL